MQDQKIIDPIKSPVTRIKTTAFLTIIAIILILLVGTFLYKNLLSKDVVLSKKSNQENLQNELALLQIKYKADDQTGINKNKDIILNYYDYKKYEDIPYYLASSDIKEGTYYLKFLQEGYDFSNYREMMSVKEFKVNNSTEFIDQYIESAKRDIDSKLYKDDDGNGLFIYYYTINNEKINFTVEHIFDTYMGIIKIYTYDKVYPYTGLKLDKDKIVADINKIISEIKSTLRHLPYDFSINPGTCKDSVDLPSFGVSQYTVSHKSDNYYLYDDCIFHSPDGNIFEIGATKLPRADAKTFEVLSEYYAKDKYRIYYKSKEVAYLADLQTMTYKLADPNTFVISSDGIARDKHSAYENGRPFWGSDPTTFKKLDSDNEFYKDKYYVDKNSLYTYNSSVELDNPKSLRILAGGFFTDDVSVYWETNKLSTIDVSAFTVLGSIGYAKDSNNVYFGNYIVKNADLKSFTALDSVKITSGSEYLYDDYLGGGFAKDNLGVYYKGFLVKDADAESFVIKQYPSNYYYFYGQDKDQCYLKYDQGKDENGRVCKNLKKLLVISCDEPDANIITKIENAADQIESDRSKASAMMIEINKLKNTPNFDPSDLNLKTIEYNNFEKQINISVQALKTLAYDYKNKVAAYNSCLKQKN